MKLRDLLNEDFSEIAPLLEGEVANVEISGLSSDSRKVMPGMLFVAVPGAKTDGAEFVHDAVLRGAAAIVSAQHMDLDVPAFTVSNPRRILALAAARYYQKQPETLVAVTGTAGKTSVVSFARQIWAQAGMVAAQVGTTGVISPNRNEYGSRTTPDSVELHRILKDLWADDVGHVAMEASSHGLDQCRLDGVRLTAGAFTNLGRDHMDYHPSIDHYMAAKMRLFDTLLPKGAPAVIFADGEASDKAADIAAGAGLDVRAVGRRGKYLILEDVQQLERQQVMKIRVEDKTFAVTVPLVGEFQIANVLVAIGLAISTGVPPALAISAAETLVGAPGRLERIGATPDGAPVFVDYAHKPEALGAALAATRRSISGRLIVVFGCGGDRDKGKRRTMGEIASRFSDFVIVTDDNPRSENPSTIRSEILSGAPGAIEIVDRAKAIREAVRMLRPGDALIVAGKGHEEGQIIGDTTVPFSDREEARQALSEVALSDVGFVPPS
ncbi:UDP-N-acetylmuramoyl-L-alanyl-D-glutamate--2,6-diaminopimelate ligase [Rhizobium mesoamericanum]|uniref:UDP-N-acetylmuramoyl-L-alanyl-D-glutamate--2, 6-diaminopimelate ligase n=1 Tax=Rhizobium mesoamericanum TaxID=1079800 RepID=UPI00277E2C8F|nr:UDP-N-acetylmuramoyl-L-alanyl-D-glutamate--2,6-diaminopimelate ligase [Rhizobium mesoamericanum]MDQ0562961.1 UDP-N-acetylmuramoyl-L-alanyl-D-glutamate--2,6-diaminopimelate ligase [Rhizobium mesoamericanum]